MSGSEDFNPFANSTASAQAYSGITTKAFALNIAVGLGIFTLELTGFLILKSQLIGKRIYQPKTFLVQEKLRVEPVAANPYTWLRRILSISDDELLAKCGLDGYFLIRLIRALLIIFTPLMVIIVTILLPINYNGGAGKKIFQIGNQSLRYNIVGLDTLSWQNVAPTHTSRYWAHLICALLTVGWTLWRIFQEKLHFIKIRQRFLASPDHRIKASARTVLVTNIPHEYRSKEALKALYDVFVGDDRSKLHVWLNRDYDSLKKLVNRRRNLCHALEKEELKLLRAINQTKAKDSTSDIEAVQDDPDYQPTSTECLTDGMDVDFARSADNLEFAFNADVADKSGLWQKYISNTGKVTICQDEMYQYYEPSSWAFWKKHENSVTMPKVAWLRYQIAFLTLQIEDLLEDPENEERFSRHNSAFIQFDKQMQAQMAVELVAHHLPGRMSPRFYNVAPHEVLWPNLGLTSFQRFSRTVSALILFIALVVLWAVPTFFLGIISQLQSLRETSKNFEWLKRWPEFVVVVISGPVSSILLALLVQLVVPALCRKLAVLVGCSTRSSREIVTARFYFSFLFIELVLVTSISSAIIAVVPQILENPTKIPDKLATNLPKAANGFLNYLIIQGLGFGGSVLSQYLRVLYITLIWPWSTQTPRQEAWLQTVIPHQMWGNVYPLLTNFACIALIYAAIAPLVLIIVVLLFGLLYISYVHNYFYVQRAKVDTYGQMFQTALHQLMTGIYVGELCLVGLFLLVRDTQDKVACTPQAIIMIITILFTLIFHFVMETVLSPLYNMLPVTMEDDAAEAERRRFQMSRDTQVPNSEEKQSAETNRSPTLHGQDIEVKDTTAARTTGAQVHHPAVDTKGAATRLTLGKLRDDITARLTANEVHALQLRSTLPRRLEIAKQLGEALAGYPDELSDLTPEEQRAELRAAYQDPVTRTPHPTIWIPRDDAGISEDIIARVEEKYGKSLAYSNAGAVLRRNNKCQITRPPPDVRPDWLLEWYL